MPLGLVVHLRAQRGINSLGSGKFKASIPLWLPEMIPHAISKSRPYPWTGCQTPANFKAARTAAWLLVVTGLPISCSSRSMKSSPRKRPQEMKMPSASGAWL